ncbi:MAG TPA: hypothetical protein VG672_28330 [Bryobacteraceae bacterium]|nr:hypothetical protein [Bryobacteraceae bacterium]
MLDAQTHRLRPLQGVPGAAVLGPSLDLGTDIAAAVLPPRQDYALALTGDNQDVQVVHFTASGPTLAPIEGVGAAPDRMVLSPSGAAAGFYRQASGMVQVVTGLPDAPVLARELAVAGADQDLAALAINDDGQILAVGLEDATNLLLWRPGGNTTVPLPDRIRAIAFRPHTRDVAVATANNQVLLLADLSGQSQPAVVAGSDEGVAAPVALAFSGDGQKLFTANSDPGSVTISDLAQRAASILTCNCSPSGLARLKGTAVFRLTEAHDPLLLLDGTTNLSRILFVPPDPPAAVLADAGANAQEAGQ